MSASASSAARRWRWSAPMAPARPRCCGRSPARICRPAGASCSATPTSRWCPRTGASAWASRWCRRGGGCSPQMTVEENLLLGKTSRPGRRLERRAGAGDVPQPQAAPPRQGRQSVGRRAAGDRDRPCADDQSRNAAARRGVARPVAARRRPRLCLAAGADRDRHDDRPGRAGSVARHGASPTACSACWKAASCWSAARPTSRARRSRRPISGCARSTTPGARGHDQPARPGRAARRLLRADRLRPVLHVLGDAHHQSGAWQPGRAVGIRAVGAGRAVRHSALRRAGHRAARHGGDRLGAAALSARAQRARRRPAADPHHLRPGDRHRQSAVRAVRRRHALAGALYRQPLLRFLGMAGQHLCRQAGGADPGRCGRRCSAACSCS